MAANNPIVQRPAISITLMEIILRVGCEGGSLTLWGYRAGSQWLYFLESRDVFCTTTLPREMTDTWDSAVQLLDARPHWVCFHPVAVHEEFRARVFEAWHSRSASFLGRPGLRYVASEWEALGTG